MRGATRHDDGPMRPVESQRLEYQMAIAVRDYSPGVQTKQSAFTKGPPFLGEET